MVIEWLKFKVNPEVREQFVQQDGEIWTPFLSTYGGFLSKQTWISPDLLDEIVLVTHWASLEEWKSIPQEQLDETEATFRAAMGDTYELVEGKAYQVRRSYQLPSPNDVSAVVR